ncbi:MAG: sigma-70 family RNA polymerase sigma factor [Oscillospiraceae bacterium]|nr:sigma-70 family RNA polymerase sigma factor [Oscillospiraceae bacterium]
MAVIISSTQLNDAMRGDEAALAGVLTAMLPTISAFAVRSVCPGLDKDDLTQEGLLGLFHAIGTYQTEGGASFTTYATRCIQNAMLTAQKQAGRKKHSPLNHFVPLNEEGIVLGPEEITIEKEEYLHTMQNINTRLSAFEKEVLLLFLDGLSYEQIADKLAKTPKAVDNALSRVRRKLKV